MDEHATLAMARPDWRTRAGAVALALVPAAMLAILLLREVWDVDIFWQLKLGELILANGGPVVREPFAAPHLGEPLPAVAWLGQALFALARRLGGWTGLRLFDALCWSGGFWLTAAACRLRGAGAWRVAFALSLAFAAALATASIRPQSYAVLCFGALLMLLKLELRPWLSLLLGAPLLVAWQNLHPSVSIAAVALAAHAAAGWIRHYKDRACAPPWSATLLLPAVAVAMFATPDGFGILAVSARNAQASLLVGASEWFPLWAPANLDVAGPVILVCLVALASLRGTRPLPWCDLAVMLAMLAMTLTAYRFVLFWALATIPVVSGKTGSSGPSARMASLAGAGVLAVSLAVPLAWPTRFSDNLPLAAAARLRAEDVTGTIFNEPEFGGVLIDTGYPRWRVSYDGRYYRYTDDEWGRFGEVLAGTVKLREIVRRYHPAAFVLRPSHSTPLCAELDRPGSGWRKIWQDQGAAVWVPRAPIGPPALAREGR